VVTIPNIEKRLDVLEGPPPVDAYDYMVECVLSRLDDDSLDIFGLAARYREAGHSEDEVEQYLDGKRRLDGYWRALKTFEQINADLIERAARGERVEVTDDEY
jgi:hypothetical protein